MPRNRGILRRKRQRESAAAGKPYGSAHANKTRDLRQLATSFFGFYARKFIFRVQ
jgi:hypothetical protein